MLRDGSSGISGVVWPGQKLIHKGASVRILLAVVLLAASGMPVGKSQTHAEHGTRAGAVVPIVHLKSRKIRLPTIDGKDLRFSRLPNTEGLSQTRVSQIIQDDQGFLWFGTQHGLDRYDGYKFKAFTHDSHRANSISGVFIQSLFKDRSGAIWVGTDQALDKFDRATESFTHFHIDDSDPAVVHIAEDDAGSLWLATATGLYRMNSASGHVVRYSHDSNDSSTLSSDDVQMTGQDRTGQYWVVTAAGLDSFDRAAGKVTLHIPFPELVPEPSCSFSCRFFHEDHFGVFWIVDNGLAAFNRKTNTLTRYSFEEEAPAQTPVNALLEDHDGTMWFGTTDGLLKFDRARNRFIRYRRSPGDPGSLTANRIISLFEDREGTTWVGFNATVPDYFTRKPVFDQFLPGLADAREGENLVASIYEDREGSLWMGANEAFNRVDRKTGEYVRYHPAGPAVKTDVITIFEDNSHAFWLGVVGRGLIRFDQKTSQFRSYRHRPGDPSSISSDMVTRILVDRTGVMWVDTGDGLNRFDPATGHFTLYKRDPGKPEPYYSLVEDRDGVLWLGSLSGLVRFAPATGQFTTFQHKPTDSTSLSDNIVDSIFEDRFGTLWIGTQDGLDKLDPKTLTFTSFYKRDGLPGNAVSCILADERDILWMSTNEGLSSFNPRTRTFRNYSVADGLPGNDLTGWDACYRSPTGEMFFGGFAGAIAFYPNRLSGNPYVPPVVFTDLQISHESVGIGSGSPLKRSITYADDLSLSPDQNFFSIEFAALSFHSPSTNRYRYKVEGLDPDWHEVGSQQRTVNFTALPSGDYELLVQGATSRGSWSDGTKLRIKVMPPWWNTWWFRVIYSVLIILAVWSAYLYRLRQITQKFNVRLEARVSERTRLARDLHDTLLQSFQGLVFRLQAVEELLPPGKAKKQLEQILERTDEAIAEGRRAVYDLRSSATSSDDLAQAVTEVANELAGEGSPNFRLVVEGPVRDLQPILRDEVYSIAREGLRNAFSHAQAHHIEAEITYTEQLFRLRIRDDGNGIAAAVIEAGRPGHYGLMGIRERARQIGAKLEMWSGAGTGTEIDLSIPGSIAYTKSPMRSRLRLFRGGAG